MNEKFLKKPSPLKILRAIIIGIIIFIAVGYIFVRAVVYPIWDRQLETMGRGGH